MEQRTRHRQAARAVLLMLTLLGLLAMHGLPDHLASAATEHMAVASAATHHVAGAGGPSLAAPTACGMEHMGCCVAVLRDAWHPSTDVPASTSASVVGRPSPCVLTDPARGPRAPPDVSLVELGISRT